MDSLAVDLDTLVRLYREGIALELHVILQCTGECTPFPLHMRFTTTLCTLSIGRGQDDGLDELVLISTHAGPESQTRGVAALSLARIQSGLCLNDIGACGTKGEGISKADVLRTRVLGNGTSCGRSESAEKEIAVDHSEC